MLTTHTICIQGDSPNMITPFFVSSIMQLVKIKFLKILNIIKDNLFKFLRFFFILLKRMSCEDITYKLEKPHFILYILKGYFSEQFSILKSI